MNKETKLTDQEEIKEMSTIINKPDNGYLKNTLIQRIRIRGALWQIFDLGMRVHDQEGDTYGEKFTNTKIKVSNILQELLENSN